MARESLKSFLSYVGTLFDQVLGYVTNLWRNERLFRSKDRFSVLCDCGCMLCVMDEESIYTRIFLRSIFKESPKKLAILKY